jgi:predicted nucleotidyltransferase
MIQFTLENREIQIENNNIEAICIFGSLARGENDELSDIDILILIDGINDQDTMDIKLSLSNQMGIPIDWLSVYRITTFEHMADKGSYFLWHLKLEGKVIYSRTDQLYKILDSLKEYTNIKNDLDEYAIICKDILDSVKSGNLTIDYELSLLASLVRNTCIAIAYMSKKYLFGRISPVEYCLKELGQPNIFELDEYMNLYNYRIKYIRPNSIKKESSGDLELVRFWIEKVQILLNYAIIKSEGRE